MINKSFSESCEQNKAIIYETIEPYLLDGIEVLEIGYRSTCNPFRLDSTGDKLADQRPGGKSNRYKSLDRRIPTTEFARTIRTRC